MYPAETTQLTGLDLSRLNALIRKRIFATATRAERIEALYLYRKLLGRECSW